jgi:hypothetical protein
LTDETQASADPARPEADARPDDSIRASIERLVVAGKELADAELAWAKIKGRGIARILRTGLLLASIALVCLSVGLVLLLVAGVVALAPVVGLLGATLIMSGVALAGAAIFALAARAVLRQLASPANDGDAASADEPIQEGTVP